MKFILKYWILILILCIAAFFRLYKLSVNPISLFGDELDLGYQAYSILKTGRDYQGNFMPLHFHSLAEWRTPLYLYSAVPTVAAFGISPFGVRLPAVFFGLMGVLGIYLLVYELLSYGFKDESKKIFTRNQLTSFAAAFLLALSPWHLQYSRAGFEVTMLLAFLIFGLYFFFVSLRKKGAYLWLSVLFLTFTPWIYSTAKLFTPVLLIFLFLIWRKEILGFSKKTLLLASFWGLIVGFPVSYSTIFGGGAQRAEYTSVFTDPTTISSVGVDRMMDSLTRGDLILGSKPTFIDRLFHNKLTSWWKAISGNYFQSFSFDFLFVKGDPNPRHSPNGIGEFYKIEVVALIIGFMFFLFSVIDKRIKLLILFLLVLGALPAELTRDGGNHATRLILILPPLIFLIAYGYYEIWKFSKFIFIGIVLIWLVEFVFYIHLYYVHYPWDSERWWHSGYGQSFQTIKSVDEKYDKIIISMSGEPVWIFFAGWYEYPPSDWQKNFPIGNDVWVNGFGKISHIGKYYFGSFNVPGKGIYDLGEYINSNTLYLAVAKEIGANLIDEPERAPDNLKLIKAIAYPSGEPAYYLFSGTR